MNSGLQRIHHSCAFGLMYMLHRALESILLSVLSALEAELVLTRNLIGGLLAELEDDIDRDKFKRLLHYSRRLASFQNRAKLVRKHHRFTLRQFSHLHSIRFRKLWKRSWSKVSSRWSFATIPANNDVNYDR